MSVYCSPSVERAVFETLLEDLENNIIIKNRRRKIIGGDLNARARTWDKKYNNRGYILEEWAAKNEIVIMNDGKIETCVRAQGSSMVDITMGTEAAMRAVRVWEVEENIETLSNHKYIIIKMDRIKRGNNVTRGYKFPRWNTKKLDKDWFAASVVGGD